MERWSAVSSDAQVRILLVEPTSGAGSAGSGCAEALDRLGADTSVERVGDTAEARARIAEGPELDLVVADRDLGPSLWPLLAELRADGPPAIVVTADREEEVALRAFRAGAADCVALGPDLDEVLPVAALEQVRRWRERQRRRARRALERRVDALESVNENIIQNMNSALLVVDSKGGIVFANPSAERILGAEEGGLRGRSVREWFPPPAGEEIHLLRTLAEGARFRGAETLLRRSDGSLVPIGISCAPLQTLDEGGTPGAEEDGQPGAVAIFQDLSEIKQLQRQVLQTEKMASIGQLAAGIAHEINNPMGFIHANLSQLAEYLDDLGQVWEGVGTLRKAVHAGDPAAAREAVAGLDRRIEEVDADYLLGDFGKAVRESLEGAERIRHIVQDLRAFSHQDTDQSVDSDLNQALDSTANIVWTMMKHSVVLTKEYQELPPVRCRPMQLKQVFMNLLINAYQAIEARGDAPGPRGEIRLRTEPTRDGVRIRVEDNGTGIAPEHLDRIFDPFFTTKEVGVGMGLGLSTSFSIVRRHGGSLRATSRPGEGTRFEVELPLDGRARDPGAGRG